MFVTDLKKDFFDLLLSDERVLVIANIDVDSICAVKILQTLLQCEHVSYTLLPITGKSDLIKVFEENITSVESGSEGRVKHVVMINCGGTMDIVDFLDPPDDVIIFIIDSHRPIDVCNFYNDGQIRLLMKADEEEDVPQYDDIFQDTDSEGEDEGENSDDEGSEGKRPRFDESKILKRRNRRLWEEKRGKLLFDYQQFSYYGPSSAVLMYELAWKMTRDTNELLWLAIIGHTEQHLLLKTQSEQYLIDTGTLREHVSRLNHRLDAGSTSVNTMKLAFNKELNLNLYRHWSLYESLLHTVYTASRFRIWMLKGKQRLSEFLAELGLPLVQCKQKFSTMNLELRNEITTLFEEKSDKYGLEDITYGSFIANFGFRHKFCAADIVYACLALMEQHSNSNVNVAGDVKKMDRSPADAFLEALEGLSRSKIELLEQGIEKAKHRLKLVVNQVQSFLDLRNIISAGPFLYAIIQDGTPDCKAFSRPNTLSLLAHFTLRAHLAMTTSKKVQSLPLVISAPLDQSKGTCLVIGVPPVSDRSRRNLLGKAFEQAARKSGSRYLLNYFDSSMIELKTEDRSKFLDSLISVLA